MRVSAAEHAQASEYKNVFYADSSRLFCRLEKASPQKSHQITITSCHKVLSEHKQINVDLINALTAADIPLEK
ncbi:12293_t:CDS:2, partial [Cetraspora pellucida]